MLIFDPDNIGPEIISRMMDEYDRAVLNLKYPKWGALLSPARKPNPKITPAADTNEAMREQLEYLIEHVHGGMCGCSICEEYLREKQNLLGKFMVTS